MFGFKLQFIVEILRWFDEDFGFFAESVRSVSPAEGWNVPSTSLRSLRVYATGENLWIPCGGDKKGTLCVQVLRMQASNPIFNMVSQRWLEKSSTSLALRLKNQVAKVRGAKDKYSQRFRTDKGGFYDSLSRIEATAARRPSISLAEIQERGGKILGDTLGASRAVLGLNALLARRVAEERSDRSPSISCQSSSSEDEVQHRPPANKENIPEAESISESTSSTSENRSSRSTGAGESGST
jgi:hypothetical protein